MMVTALSQSRRNQSKSLALAGTAVLRAEVAEALAVAAKVRVAAFQRKWKAGL
jgi:hypothetical protein